jgi:hypothetical protein
MSHRHIYDEHGLCFECDKVKPAAVVPAPYWWHGGTTCHDRCTVHWIGHGGRFVLLKHTGHSEYTDRVSGTQYCPTHFALFDMEQVGDARSVWSKPDLALATWEGRWTKARQDRVEQLAGTRR